MAATSERWIDGLQFSSLFWPPPQDPEQRKAQITAYVDYFGQFTSEQFPEDIAELVRHRYPSNEKRLFDDVLAMFVLHHPEHGHAVILPIISCIIDGTMEYDRSTPPFASFISLVCPSSDNEYSEQWALACGEILRILTHYNRPIFKMEGQHGETDRSSSGSQASTSNSTDGESSSPSMQHERKPLRPLSPWITDLLLAAPLGIRSDYFRWCGGVMGKYAAGELKPPSVVLASSRGSGKHPQLMPATPRWAVANGAAVILSVCDEEVARYETATLTAAAVPALLLPPPTTAMDEHLVAGLPALEPYARLFHRYYAIASPSATQRLLLGLLEAPPSWAPDALDAAVQLVELLRAAEDYASGMRLPRNWMHLHFLRAIGTAMSMRAGIAADSAAALLFRILSQPALLFPPLRQVEGVEVQREPMGGYVSSHKKQRQMPAAEATIEATAQGIASMLCAHGPEVEWRICTIWEAAYGLIPLSSSVIDLPEIIVATPLQPPILSWNLYIPLLKVLEYLPRGSPSEACLMKIFVATVEAILQRTFPAESLFEQTRKTRYVFGSASKNLAVAELRTMVHSLFLESCATVELSSRLLFVILTVCVSHEAQLHVGKKPRGEDSFPHVNANEESEASSGKQRKLGAKRMNKQGPVAAFDSYVLAAVCALACELQLFPLISRTSKHSNLEDAQDVAKAAKAVKSSNGFQNSIDSAVSHTRRILAILEALFSLKPSSVGTSWSYSSNEIVAAAMVAAHISELFRRSKACMHALSVLMRCKWDKQIHSTATSLYNLIDIHSKAVASIVNKAEPLDAHLLHAPIWKDSLVCLNGKRQNNSANASCSETGQSSTMQFDDPVTARTLVTSEKVSKLCEDSDSGSEKGITSFPFNASELANFLTMDRHIGFNCSARVLLRSVLTEKQELCFSVVSLLWHKMIASPETQLSAESTSAQQGWRQVVDALCNVVSASPTTAATAIVLQAGRELQPWIAKDDDLGQKMWRINQRIVKLIVELMRNHDMRESLVILSSALDLLLRATDGMLVDGEACTLPQLELLEATARAVHPVLEWGESGLAVADGLSNLLKCRLPATVRCLSHPSAHVRTLSISVLRAILHVGPIKASGEHRLDGGNGIVEWEADLGKCLTWEAHSRVATGMPIEYLDTAAKELGCPIAI
ncbi:protein GIGANTEA-like [Cynara cardunculus var. scolymus]|uniref:protein GIGANTEA-like n=1 Tax=Cynara cardunculus var. scolymus TaxID=59895 RepID=UPI000D62347F|nr:protein GIGANTEA-like [Cynara cardunculus var. scolymus]